MEAVVLGIALDGFLEGLGRRLVAVLVQRFHANGCEVGSLKEEKQRQHDGHGLIITIGF